MANPDGLHIRAASLVAKRTSRLPAKVELIKGNRRVDATNVLQIVSLCALEGDQLLLEATGQDAEAALDALVDLFENGFSEVEPADPPEHSLGEMGPSEAAPDGDASAQ